MYVAVTAFCIRMAERWDLMETVNGLPKVGEKLTGNEEVVFEEEEVARASLD